MQRLGPEICRVDQLENDDADVALGTGRGSSCCRGWVASVKQMEAACELSLLSTQCSALCAEQVQSRVDPRNLP